MINLIKINIYFYEGINRITNRSRSVINSIKIDIYIYIYKIGRRRRVTRVPGNLREGEPKMRRLNDSHRSLSL